MNRLNVKPSKPAISVIMPFYNCERFLDDSIQSILNQTFRDFEFIIINDASTDRSNDVMKRYLGDQRIVYVNNNENKGIVQNLNHGLEIAKADLIARMDGDDISDVTRLEKQFRFLLDHPDIDSVGTFVCIIDKNGKQSGRNIIKPLHHEEIAKDIFTYMTMVHATAMIRKKVYDSIGFYRQKYLFVEDTDFTYRMLYSGYCAHNIPEFLYSYRYHDNSTAHQQRKNALKGWRLRREAIKQFSLRPSFKEYFFMYMHLITGLLLSGRRKQKLEQLYKKIFYGE